MCLLFPCYSPALTLVAVACANRFEETLVMIKSALLLTRGPIYIHLFTDDDRLMQSFRQKVI